MINPITSQRAKLPREQNEFTKCNTVITVGVNNAENFECHRVKLKVNIMKKFKQAYLSTAINVKFPEHLSKLLQLSMGNSNFQEVIFILFSVVSRICNFTASASHNFFCCSLQ